MKKIKLGMIGGSNGSFFGDAHRRAARICNDFSVVGGVFSSQFNKTLELAELEDFDKNRCYSDVQSLVTGENSLAKEDRMQVVSIVTPNNLHYQQAKILLENNFHVICDKPVTITVAEAEELGRIVARTGKVFCVTHTYTGYPMVRQIKEFIKQGVVGNIQRIDVQYYQSWVNPLIHGGKSELNIWKLDPEITGISSCMGDIGVHVFNLVEYTTGIKVARVLADLNNYSPDIKLDLDGTVLLGFNENLRGVLRASQIANGEENSIKLAIYGSKAGLKWQQENPNRLSKIEFGKPEIIYKPGNKYNTEFAEASHTMPFGHPEGIYEALANIYKGVAKSIRGIKTYDGEYPGIEDGIRGMKFIESVVRSNQLGNQWVDL